MQSKLTMLIVAIGLFCTTAAKAQNYMPQVSSDSLSILKDRVKILKASLKIQELKIKESEEESDVEKLRVKLLAANANSKESAAKNNDISKKLSSGSLDAKAIEKIAKKAKDDMSTAQKALDSYNKQIKRVDDIRSDIRVEEEKLKGIKPGISFSRN